MTLFLGYIGILPRLASVLFILICIFLILVILIQKGRGGGLSSAFGGGGGSQSVFGSKTGDMLTWVTISVTIIFFLLAMYLSPNFKPQFEDEIATPAIQSAQPLEEQPADQNDATESAPADLSSDDQTKNNDTAADSSPAPAPANSETPAPANTNDTDTTDQK